MTRFAEGILQNRRWRFAGGQAEWGAENQDG